MALVLPRSYPRVQPDLQFLPRHEPGGDRPGAAAYAGWERETRAFSSNAASGTPPPRWADYDDPLDAIGARFKARMAQAAERQDGKPLSGEDRSALRAMGLGTDADRKALRTRYTELVRRFHPDHNGGDRAHEKALQDVLAAYAHLRKAPAFA